MDFFSFGLRLTDRCEEVGGLIRPELFRSWRGRTEGGEGGKGRDEPPIVVLEIFSAGNLEDLLGAGVVYRISSAFGLGLCLHPILDHVRIFPMRAGDEIEREKVDLKKKLSPRGIFLEEKREKGVNQSSSAFCPTAKMKKIK